MDVLLALVIGFVLALTVAVLWSRRKRGRAGARETRTYASIMRLKAIGELSAFKALTKEIVTEVDHTWGEFGKSYLSWILSNKKILKALARRSSSLPGRRWNRWPRRSGPNPSPLCSASLIRNRSKSSGERCGASI